MYCPQCGMKNADEWSFCAECGAPLNTAVLTSASAPAAFAPAPKGCVGQALSDITGSPHWIKRVFLLMLMNCVPILNIYVAGYSLQWGAQAARGKSEPLAPGSFDAKTFLLGLFPLLLSILMALGTSIFFMFLFIPIIGALFVAVVNLLAYAFYVMSTMRAGVTGKLSRAFDLSELFRAYRKNLSGLLAASIVPALLGGLVVFVIGVLLMALVGVSSYAAFSAMNGSSYGFLGSFRYGYVDPSAVFGVLAGLSFALTIIVILALFAEGFVNLWIMRAVGYWVRRNVPEWAESEEAAAPASVPIVPAPSSEGAASTASAADSAAANASAAAPASGAEVTAPVSAPIASAPPEVEEDSDSPKASTE